MSEGLKKIYSEISTTYEFVNHLLTFGLDVLWRERAAAIASKDGGERWLDLCCGTGEMTSNLKYYGRATIVSADFSPEMMSLTVEKGSGDHFALADARTLPFKTGSFDLVTVSFATRNLNVDRVTLLSCFREIHRVLKPDGRFVNVETSHPPSGPVRVLFHIYTKHVIPAVGRAFGDSGPGYKILSRTMLRFYDAEELKTLLREVGFDEVEYTRMLFGAAAIHVARD